MVLNESTSGKLPVGIKLLNKRKCVCHRETEIVAQPQARAHIVFVFGRHALPAHADVWAIFYACEYYCEYYDDYYCESAFFSHRPRDCSLRAARLAAAEKRMSWLI